MRRRSERPASGSRYQPETEQGEFYPSFTLGKRSAALPSKDEISDNVRSRSARLRCAVRTEAEMFDDSESLLASVPQLSDYRWAA